MLNVYIVVSLGALYAASASSFSFDIGSFNFDYITVEVTRQSGKVLSYAGILAEFGERLPNNGWRVLNAELAGYSAAIVYSLTSEILVAMKGDDVGKNVSIPSVYVGRKAGQFFLHSYDRSKDRVYVEYDSAVNNVALIAVIVICTVLFVVFIGVLIAAVVILCPCRAGEERLLRRRRRANLKKIPVRKFKPGDSYDICAICLEDYKVGDKLRILHCSHVYHCKCIDTWLVQDSDLCPLCKKSVIEDDEYQEAASASAGAGTGQSVASAAGSINNAEDDEDDHTVAEDAPLLHGPGRQRPRRYGSRLRAAPVLRVHQGNDNDDDNDDTERGLPSLFVHRHPQLTPPIYGSTTGQSQADSQPDGTRVTPFSAGEPPSDVHVSARHHRNRRGRRAARSSQMQPDVEDV